MTKIKLFLFLCMSVLLGGVNAADIKDGKLKHDNKCTSCHSAKFPKDNTAIYTRKDRKMKNLATLTNRVKACNSAAKAKFSDAELANVTEYLNTTFYKFTK